MPYFECPFYNDIRLKFRHLFQHVCSDAFQNNDMTVWSWVFLDENFRIFMNGYQDPCFWLDLSHFLIACREKRKVGMRAITSVNQV